MVRYQANSETGPPPLPVPSPVESDLPGADSFFARSSFFAESLLSLVSGPFSFFDESFGVVAATSGFLGVALGIGFGLCVGETFGGVDGGAVGFGFGVGVGVGTGVGDGRWISLRATVVTCGSSCFSRSGGAVSRSG